MKWALIGLILWSKFICFRKADNCSRFNPNSQGLTWSKSYSRPRAFINLASIHPQELFTLDSTTFKWEKAKSKISSEKLILFFKTLAFKNYIEASKNYRPQKRFKSSLICSENIVSRKNTLRRSQRLYRCSLIQTVMTFWRTCKSASRNHNSILKIKKIQSQNLIIFLDLISWKISLPQKKLKSASKSSKAKMPILGHFWKEKTENQTISLFLSIWVPRKFSKRP